MQAPNAQQIVLLLLVASLVSMAARRLRLPASSGLIAAGLALAFLPHHGNGIGLTQQQLFTAFLPALIFESALNLRASQLRTDWLPLTILATAGVAINMAVTSLAMHFAASWPWRTALLFGALTSATDPIAVVATFKQAKVSGRPRLLAEAESLANDGIAVVALGLVLLASANHGAAQYASSAVSSLAITVGGGVGIGLAIGWLLSRLMGTVDDPLVETTLTFVGAYGAYFAADRIGGSGILAATACGLVMGNYGILSGRYVTARGREIVESLWEFVAFIANALVFLLMGFNLSHAHVRESIVPVAAGIVSALAGRAVAVYASSALVSRTDRRIPIALQHILIWGGQRGALSLVLAVAVFPSAVDGRQLITATAGLVAFSILFQGLTFEPIIKRLLKGSAPWTLT